MRKNVAPVVLAGMLALSNIGITATENSIGRKVKLSTRKSIIENVKNVKNYFPEVQIEEKQEVIQNTASISYVPYNNTYSTYETYDFHQELCALSIEYEQLKNEVLTLIEQKNNLQDTINTLQEQYDQGLISLENNDILNTQIVELQNQYEQSLDVCVSLFDQLNVAKNDETIDDEQIQALEQEYAQAQNESLAIQESIVSLQQQMINEESLVELSLSLEQNKASLDEIVSKIDVCTSRMLEIQSVSSLFNMYGYEAEDDGQPAKVIYTSPDGQYVWDKLSHPSSGAGQTDGIVDYIGNGVVVDQDNGQGDRGQSYSWASISYEDWVYVGTCYDTMGNTLQFMKSVLGNAYDEEIMKATLNAIFNGDFFLGEEDGGIPGGVLVKVNVNSGQVKIVMGKEQNGYMPKFRNAIRYQDKLYFCGACNQPGNALGLPSIYQINPENDDIQCVYTGMTPQEYVQSFQQGICTGIRGMTVYKNRLVVSCVGVDGPYVMITDNPEDHFEIIANQQDLFNYPAYHYSDSIYGGSIWEMVSFNDSIYVALCTGTPDNKPDEYTMQSFAIVKGQERANGSWQWTPVVGDLNDGAKYTFGIDPERTRAGACNLIVYNGYLYIGEYEDIEIALENLIFNKDFQFLAKNLEQSVSLYRMDKEENIELVVGDATAMFPEGSLSGLESGFGRRENEYIWQSVVYDGKLFIGTFDCSSLLEPLGQFTNGDIIHQDKDRWESQLQYIRVLLQLLIQKVIGNSAVNSYQLIATAIDDISSVNGINLELTQEQISNLMQLIEQENNLDESLMQQIHVLNQRLNDLNTLFNEKGSLDFKDLYLSTYGVVDTIRDLLPESVVSAIESLINIMSIDNLNAFAYVMNVLSNANRGFDFYVSEDGINFDTITINGFNDPYNHGLRVFATGEDWMVIGTANPFYGTQLWKLSEEKEIPEVPSVEDPSVIEQTTIHSNQQTPTGIQTNGSYYFLGILVATGLLDVLRRKYKMKSLSETK